jgi:hypothetical protein
MNRAFPITLSLTLVTLGCTKTELILSDNRALPKKTVVRAHASRPQPSGCLLELAYQSDLIIVGTIRDNPNVESSGGETEAVSFLPDYGAPLRPNHRYLLFLKIPDASDREKATRFRLTKQNGREYRVAQVDMLTLADQDRGQVLLEDGRTWPGGTPERPISPWQFEVPERPQLIGVSEEEAIKATVAEIGAFRDLRFPNTPKKIP